MSTLTDIHHHLGAELVQIGDCQVPRHYGDVQAEYRLASQAGGVHDRSYRGLLEVSGADRTAWLHNLLTNEIKNLSGGDGNYAFGLNVRGRILFDCNCLVSDEVLELDVDRRWLPQVLRHLNKYVIMEAVQLRDLSSEYGRIAVVGPQALTVHRNWPQLQYDRFKVAGVAVHAFRNDFAGVPAVEYIVPVGALAVVWEALAGGTTRQAVGTEALEILRVESGIPESVADLDESRLPAETRQLDRAVSFQKGCYLGQEVVERMRAHGSVARLLVGLAFSSPHVQPGMKLEHDGQEVGRVTSVVRSVKLGQPIGLGYVKTPLARAAVVLQATSNGKSSACSIAELPFEK